MFNFSVSNPIKSAVIIGHPGHELRIYKFIKTYTPDVYILTDGSGANNKSRINNSIKFLESLGANYIAELNPIPDKSIYNFILKNDFSEINSIKNILKKNVFEKKYNLILGDALEGFNPTHDLCRYLINSIVKDVVNIDSNFSILNYSFDLDAAPNKQIDLKENVITLNLMAEELDEKINAGLTYPELQYEVEKALQLFGGKAFNVERFKKVEDYNIISNWNHSIPQYEIYGKSRVLNGSYKEVIEYEKHMKPIAKLLLNL